MRLPLRRIQPLLVTAGLLMIAGTPWRLETELQQRAGVVESGLFLEMAESVIVAAAGCINVLARGEA